MAGANAFQITISASDKATAVAKKIEASLARITKPIDRVTASAAKLNEATAKIKKPFADFGGRLKALSDETGLTRVANGIRGIGESAADAGKSLLKVVAPLAGIAGLGSIAGIALLANEWGRMGAEVQRTSAVLGVSAGDLQAYRSAAKLAGLSADDMTGSLKSLGRTLEDATYGRNQDALVMMHKFGISLHRTKDGAVDATLALKEVANAIVAQKGNVQAQSVIAGAFGVESLLPLLQKGGKGIDEFVRRASSMGLVISDKDLAKGQQFNENLLRLEAAGTRLKYSLGESLAPAVEKVLDVVGRLVDKYGQVVATKVAEYSEKFAKWIDGVDWEKTTGNIGNFVEALGGLKGIAIAIAAITFAGPIAGLVRMAALLLPLLPALAPLAALAGVGAASIGKIKDSTEPGHFVGRSAGAPNARPLRQTDTNAALWDGIKKGASDFFTINKGKFASRQSGSGGRAESDPQTAGIVARLQQMGWSGEQAAGLAANFWQESNFRPTAVGDNGRAYGIGQWHEDRQAAFKKQFGVDIRNSTLDQQLQFADYELRRGNEQNAGAALSKTRTASEAGSVVSRLYERPADAAGEAAQRGQMAAAIDQKMHVDVHLHNAPAGTKATASVRGNANATARVGTSNVTGPPV